MRIFGYDLLKLPSQGDFLKSRNVDLVLDVGANRGQYAQEIRKLGYQGRIHSFEPISAVHEKLAALAAHDPLWTSSKCAVGANAGTAEINISQNSVYSSIRSQTPMGAEFSRKSVVVSTEVVDVVTLAHFADDPANAIFLKIDTQGFEREVLEGVGGMMQKCVGVQLELPAAHLYKDVWSFAEAVQYMDRIGFIPAQFRVVNLMHDDPASAIEFDCIFRRKS